MIVLENVSKSFDGGESYAVRNLSLEIDRGETMVLLGSSGCGKTTTLKMINRLYDTTEGTIRVDNRDVLRRNKIELRRSIGYVFQGIGLFPHMTVRHNIEIALRLSRWSRSARKKRAEALLELVGLDPARFGRRLPEELSGGQQQRIGVARALSGDPDYLLMDEPFGALDALTRDTLQQELCALKERLQKTIVFVTHDIFEALTLGDRIAILHKGILQQVGTKEDVLAHPATEFVHNLFAKPAKQLSAYEDLL